MMIKSEHSMKRRAFFLFIVFILSFVVLIVNLTTIVISKGKDYKLAVFQNLDNKGKGISLNYKRGQILDRNGIILADSSTTYMFFYDPQVLSTQSEATRKKTLDYIHEHFGVTYDELYKTMNERSFSNYQVIGEEYTYGEIKEIKAAVDGYEIVGLHYREGYERVYPLPTIASDVIGFVSSDLSGSNGIELQFDEYLKGQQGRIYESVEDQNRLEKHEIEAVDGNDVMLTLDYTIQRYINEAIEHYLEEYVAKRIQVIVMVPDTGEILGMVDYPSFSLEDPYDLDAIVGVEDIYSLTTEQQSEELNKLWKNQTISDGYEPGSTFKPLVLAAALDENKVSLEDTYTCYGGLQVLDEYVECWDVHGEETVREGLENSCNVVFMNVGKELGREMLYDYQRMFGFGAQTGVELPGEGALRSGLHELEQLNPVELATTSFGQTFTITPLQLISGFSSLINGGYLYQPHIMKQVYNENQVLLETEPVIKRQVVSEEISNEITQLLAGVVNEGTGGRAKIAGYEIGGKTGTAEKIPRNNEDYIVSFIGFAPIENPQVITLVVVDEPRGKPINSRFAASIFVDVMEDVMPYLHIFKEETEEPVELQDSEGSDQ